MSGKRSPIPSGHWWRNVDNTFTKVVSEFLTRAKKAERFEAGHDCGHTFEVSVISRGHSGIIGEGPESHRDSDWWGEPFTIEVRAHNQRDALLLAAATPLPEWTLPAEPDE